MEVGKSADLTIVDGDPFTDFATLIRTVAVLRGGILFEQADWSTRSRTRPRPRAAIPPSAVDWLEVSRHMRREGCCDPESGG